MKKILVLAILPLVFALTSCKQVDLPNGEVPAQYLTLAKTYMGRYSGAFEGNDGTLTLSLVGNKVVTTFSGQVNDILGDVRCNSQIGDVASIQIDNNAQFLQYANIHFSPNACGSIQGRTLVLHFSKDSSSFRADILKEVIPVYNCTNSTFPIPGEYPNPSPPTFPNPQCRIIYQYDYLTGQFAR
jgi:hypothetical protein